MAQALDFCLRCNSLRCRAPLTERAVVTTCSHIFCLKCADDLGLSRSTGADRHCPACQALLVNPDDAVSTVLNPTEDYKTSVLSGLNPTTILECSGRALAFWTYQTTQEIFYQEYLAKTLTEKYGALNKQMDKVIHDANSEISSLQQKISDLQLSQEQLQKKNQELVEIYREKSKKHAQITNLYNLLKSRAMRSHIQTAASDSVAHALDSLGTGLYGAGGAFESNRPSTTLSTAPGRKSRDQYATGHDIEQLHRYQRSSSGHHRPDNPAMLPPTALPPHLRHTNHPSDTPQHRTRLPQAPPSTAPQMGEYSQHRGHNMPRSPNKINGQQRRGAGPTELPLNRVAHLQPNNYGFRAGARMRRPTDSAFPNPGSRPGTFSTLR